MSRNLVTPVSTRFKWDNVLGVVIERTERFDGLVDYCKARQNAREFGGKDLPMLAKVPGIMIEAWCEKRGVSMATFCRSQELKKAMLNDPEMAAFRVMPGRA